MLLITGSAAFAQFDFYATAAYITINGDSKFYNTTAPGNGQDIGADGFQNASFGTFQQNSGSLLLAGGEVKTFKAANGNVCSATLFFTVYPKNNRPAAPVYSSVGLGFYSNCTGGECSQFPASFPADKGGGCCNTGDQKWQFPAGGNGGGNDGNIDITNHEPGDYTLEIYYQVTGQENGNGCSESRYDNNTSAQANYTASFSISATLAAGFGTLAATARQGQNTLSWTSYETGNPGGLFYVERSAGTARFEVIGSVAGGTGQHSFTDNKPLQGDNYYRVKWVDRDGSSRFSSIAKARAAGETRPVLAPNPASGKVTITGLLAGSDIRVYNSAGVLVRQLKAKSATQDIPLDGLNPGRYTVRVSNKESSYNLPLLVAR